MRVIVIGCCSEELDKLLDLPRLAISAQTVSGRKLIPDFAAVTAPMVDLTKKNAVKLVA
ncbi:unnamed protein product [Ectocarpus sp. CCAP 1310/34]|nr:unnamed protein product [Ectocarpus sp. CCAP 1310/34]